jgi:hypothetical protein
MGEKQIARRSAHRSQWAAQFAVASELCKRGYEVALTLGNHPAIDLMVVSPKRVQFIVDVKGQYKKNFWPVTMKRKNRNLFYVLAFVPDVGPNRFFVLSQKNVAKGIRIDYEKATARRKSKGKPGDPANFTGVEWSFAEKHEDSWAVLPT